MIVARAKRPPTASLISAAWTTPTSAGPNRPKRQGSKFSLEFLASLFYNDNSHQTRWPLVFVYWAKT